MADVEVARLVAKLEADVRDFDRDLKKAEKRIDKFGKETQQAGNQVNKSTGSMTKSFGKMGAAVAGAFAVGQIARFAGDTVRAASDVNESINAVNVTFGEAAEGIKQLGEQAADSVGLSNAQFNSLAVSFSAFVKKIDAGGGDVVGVMDELTTRVADFASVMNLDVAEAAEKFRSGLAGETEPLRAFGIDLSAAAVNAHALAIGLADSTAELTEGDKILARYQLLMEQTEATAGDFANTSDDLANAMRRLQAKFEDAKAELGTALIPTLEDLIPVGEAVIEWVVEAAHELAVLTGATSQAQNLLAKFRVEVGKQPKGMSALVSLIDVLQDRLGVASNVGLQSMDVMLEMDNSTGELARGMLELVEAIDVTGDEFERLRSGEMDEFLMSIGFLERDIDFLIALLAGKFAAAMDAGADKALLMGQGLDTAAAAAMGLVEPLEDIEPVDVEVDYEDVEEAVKQFELLNDFIRAATDPIFKARNAQNKYNDAVNEFNEVAADSASTQEDINTAAAAMVDAWTDATLATAELDDAMSVGLFETFRKTAEEAGVPVEVIGTMITSLETLGQFRDGPTVVFEYVTQGLAEWERFMEINTNLPDRTITLPPPPAPIVRRGVQTERQHGGPLMAGQPALVGEAGPELFVPRTSGDVIPNNALGGTTIIVEGNVTDETLEDIQRELLLASLSQIGEVG